MYGVLHTYLTVKEHAKAGHFNLPYLPTYLTLSILSYPDLTSYLTLPFSYDLTLLRYLPTYLTYLTNTTLSYLEYALANCQSWRKSSPLSRPPIPSFLQSFVRSFVTYLLTSYFALPSTLARPSFPLNPSLYFVHSSDLTHPPPSYLLYLTLL